MKQLFQPKHPRRPAFTLVELLAALAVLTLILAILLRIMGDTVSATSGSRKRMEIAREARTVMDCLREDLDNIVVANNSSSVFVKATGANSEIAFITRRRGPAGVSDLRMLAVRYTLQATDLERAVSPVSWTNPNFMHAALTASPLETGVLATGILRFELVARLVDGRMVPLTSNGPWKSGTWNDEALPNGFAACKLKKAGQSASNDDVEALIVAIVILDKPTLGLPNVATMANVFAPAVADKTPSTLWHEAIAAGGLSGFPQPAAAAVQISQSTFLLP